jgi:hypothetical protein
VSGYGPAKKTPTKAQNRSDARKVVAQGIGSLRGDRAPRAATRSPSPAELARLLPDDAVPGQPAGLEAPAPRTYVAREHLRRDIGSRVLVLDLAAPDAPDGAPLPPLDPDGNPMQYAADCVTHHVQKYFGAYPTACRGAKASHQWCPGCKSALARHHRLHSKASAQASPRR